MDTGAINKKGTLTGLAASEVPNLSASKITSDTMATARLGSGTADSTTFLRGDSTWAVPTIPISTNYFRAYANSAGSSGSSTWTKVALDAETYDTQNDFDTSTNRFTASNAGGYVIAVNVAWQPAGATNYWSRVAIYKNGSLFSQIDDADLHGNNNRVDMSYTDIVYLNGTTDYIELFVWSNIALNYNGAVTGNYTFMSGALIS